ncbi:MAG TPA: c-type cytochrome, partial [Polyangiaceae bacterium LLY-WYZ-15_(1-7)]|nr:c-type cytochrome [Polyangiaceae bacterium LLY-WYZ-15_(1-7)]
CGGRYARFDGGPLAMSGPSALAWHGEAGLLWVAHRSTGNVALVACSAARGLAEPSPRRPRVLATWRVGRGPGGIALSDDGRTAWVDVGFDHAVARLVWDGVEGPHALDAALRRPLGETRLSARALEGRSVFFDARDTHLTPSGVVSCASCHPGGGEDGLRWFLHTPGVERKLRRTPPAWGARPSLAPYHWDGEFEEAERLALVTIRELMEGDGLLVDLEALAAFMAELPPPPPRPADDPAAAARGEALFAERCESCHRDRVGADGAAHGLLPPSADPDALMPAVHTPSLAGVRARPPFLHDGRAPTLRAVLTDANPADAHARTSDLDAAALADLLAYLETL